MHLKKLISLLLILLLLVQGAAMAEAPVFEPLPMNKVSAGPVPKTENYLSDNEYVDDSISVKIYSGRYAETDYIYAHVKIAHPSQLRTAPAALANPGDRNPNYHDKSTARGAVVAEAAHAVLSINGDYYTQNGCTVVLRMGTQYRNSANGLRDLLIVDYNGDFSYLTTPKKSEYAAYYKANKENMYQVFCFGPVMVENGKSVITEEYLNRYIGSQKGTQRMAICQLGPLEYAIIGCYSDQIRGNKGMTIFEFAQVCEQVGWELNPESGCRLAFNLDGGNSTTINFQRLDKTANQWKYIKVNCPEIDRHLSDIIYFATLVK